MNVVIPLAGRGQRFRDEGWLTPKPLIEVLGRPMYAWAVTSLPLELASSLTFVCLAEHLADGKLERDILSRFGSLDPEIVALDGVTDGQACTVLAGLGRLDRSLPLLVYNADTYAPHSRQELAAIMAARFDGALGVMEAAGTHWSFVELGDDGLATRTAEKERISSHACTGLYYFGSTQVFEEVAAAAISSGDRVNGEFYVAPLYNRIIADGGRVTTLEAVAFHAMGTPDELTDFLNCPPQ